MKKINDDLFGKIEFDMYWSGKTSITMFGRKYEVVLSIDGEEDANFSPIQRDAYTNFITNMDEIMATVELSILEYYEENVEEYRDMAGEAEADRTAPEISTIEELGNLVIPTQLIVRRVRKNGVRRIGLVCDCTWDIDNGVGVRIEDEKVEEVDYQDIVL
ncbi:hypothetical protein PWEIH_03451 [Listeria weihenstephanensis FSL R9-0317]|uniref:DUF6985 domain-containing protein n=1 Tax=Listeria weihenstephanensis TaxID=1006155 RepID=A0A1S7FTI5_9LIST|nr:hypothetical protein [Listeria weihenstephanensis]AQY50655.1 hypothetical protein UE46_06155 [Listeria weihenstephanensis]EUJ40584.1 hypothetical protein PWEIH_03451 [Listeria weihenstephanensis FSL R9-0317]